MASRARVNGGLARRKEKDNAGHDFKMALVIKPFLYAAMILTLSAPVALAGPFDAPSPLPYHAPQFDKIKDSDYAPAFNAGMKEQDGEIAVIANSTAAPTFQNTLVAMERSGRM